MDRRAFLVSCACCTSLGYFACADQPSKVDIQRLIDQLGSKRFREREQAGKTLEKLGVATLPALRRAAKHYPDAEVRRRAATLVKRLTPDPEPELLKRKLGYAPKVRIIEIQGERTVTMHVGDVVAFQTLAPPPGRQLSWVKKAFEGDGLKEVVTVTPEGVAGGVPLKGKATARIYVRATKAGETSIHFRSRFMPGPLTAINTYKVRIVK
jgi:hypothetical protein